MRQLSAAKQDLDALTQHPVVDEETGENYSVSDSEKGGSESERGVRAVSEAVSV
jgi:hypothetical protein